MKPRVVIYCLKNKIFELVGLGHCSNEQSALYGVYDSIEECYRECSRKFIENYNDEQYNPKNIEIINAHYLRDKKLKKINKILNEKEQRQIS